MELTREQSLRILKIADDRFSKIDAIRASCFEKQLEFIDDPAKAKVSQCTRRAGKSYAGGAYLTMECLKHPGSTCLYIATTRVQAQRILLKDILNKINRKFRIGMVVNLTQLSVTFPNGSVIYLLGLDSKPDEMEKALGQKYRLIIIDEGGSWRQDQKHMIHSVLEPACADLEGTICMIGSPVASLRSYFYDITGREITDKNRSPEAKGWSIHRWTWKDNPYVREAMEKQIARMVDLNPLVLETPGFQNMYCNKWVVDLSRRVYKFDENRNTVTQLPTHLNYNFCVTVDLGYDDDTAIVASAYSEYDPNMYIVEVFKKKKMDLTETAFEMEKFRQKYKPFKWVVDGAAKQAVEEIRKRFGFPLQPADKHGKEDMISIMNNDFIAGRIKLVEGEATRELQKEYENLVWDEKSQPGKRVENSACANHAADASLYGWRMCYHYASTDLQELPPEASDAGMLLWWKKEALRLQSKDGQDFVKNDFGNEYEGH